MTVTAIKPIVDVIQPLVTVVGALAAGVWILYNFGLTRVSAPQISIEAKIKELLRIDGRHLAIVCIDIKNSGRTRVEKRQALLALSLVQIPAVPYPLLRIGSPPDYRSDVWEILTTHSSLEPAEAYHEEVAFVVDGISLLQVGVSFIGSKAQQTWESNYLFPPPLKDGRAH